MTYYHLILAISFLAAALPIKNYLEIRRASAKDKLWTKWLGEKIGLIKYCEIHKQDIHSPVCDYCGSARQMPSLEMVIPFRPKFGLISNSVEQYSYFKSYICGGCGTELFRSRYEAE